MAAPAAAAAASSSASPDTNKEKTTPQELAQLTFVPPPPSVTSAYTADPTPSQRKSERLLEPQTVLRGRRDATEGFVVGEKGTRNPHRPLTKQDWEIMDTKTELLQRCCSVGAAVQMDDAHERPQSVFKVVSRRQQQARIDSAIHNSPPPSSAGGQGGGGSGMMMNRKKQLRCDKWRWVLHRFQHKCQKCGGGAVDYVMVVTTHTNSSSPRVVALLFADGFPCNGTTHVVQQQQQQQGGGASSQSSQLRQQELLLLEKQEKIAYLVGHVDMFASFDVIRLRDDVVIPYWEQLLVSRGLKSLPPAHAHPLSESAISSMNHSSTTNAVVSYPTSVQNMLTLTTTTTSTVDSSPGKNPGSSPTSYPQSPASIMGGGGGGVAFPTTSSPALPHQHNNTNPHLTNTHSTHNSNNNNPHHHQHSSPSTSSTRSVDAALVFDSINALHIILSYRSVVILGSNASKRIVRGWLDFFRALYDPTRVVLPEPISVPSRGGGGADGGGSGAASEVASSSGSSAAPAVCFVSLFGQKRFSWLPLPHVAAQAFCSNSVEGDLLPCVRRLADEDFDIDPMQLPCVCTVDEVTGCLFVPATQIADDQTAVGETADTSKLMTVFKAILQDIVTEHQLRQLIGGFHLSSERMGRSTASLNSDESNLTVASTSFKSLLSRNCCDSILFRSAHFWANWCRRYLHLPAAGVWDLTFVGLASDRDAPFWLQKKKVALLESQLRM